ncbi:formylmethanofuran dehydrogenase [Methanoculleus taiwanensis]|uniref:Formylmethanofuran dehydrogenase n=1 Tax=Methanoculleus taiwanensis TaxID=1550565 RepID=A0A498H4G3_9EURY|nr:FmdE family protein [Methanoculleus taiwanensis]RXE56744.1 formylmethanofuran dehydrogenase [Methanoculleus taiwanensis]
MEADNAHENRYASFEDLIRFHGHACPGLATGYRASLAAMKALGVERPYDEELVAIAETDACGVDGIQMVTGCTAGKGNLIIRDYGKHVFTFISRESGRAVRVLVCNPDIPEKSEMDDLRGKVFSGGAADEERRRFYELMQVVTERLLTLPEESVVAVREVSVEPPQTARIFASVACACCGESVADAKMRTLDGERVCIPCYEERASGR